MNPMFGFLPFVLFAILMQVSTDLALWAALAAAFGIGTYTFLHARELRILDAGGIVLFGGMALYTGFIQPSLSIAHVHLAVDAGMFVIALASLALRNSFKLPHLHRHEAGAVGGRNPSVCANYVVMGAWTLAFGLMTALDTATSFYKKITLSLDIGVGLGILGLAVIFTARYPAFSRRRLAAGQTVGKSAAIE